MIAIDPGHGGNDNGCTNNGLRESDLVYRLADMLTVPKRLLRGPDEDPSFRERARRSAGCEAVLSLHFNIGELRYSKPEIYYNGPEVPLYWLDVVPGIVSQTITCGWRFPSQLGKRVAFFDTSRYRRKGFPKELQYLTRAENCLEDYKLPAILLEVGYLNDPKVADYVSSELHDLAESLDLWLYERREKHRGS